MSEKTVFDPPVRDPVRTIVRVQKEPELRDASPESEKERLFSTTLEGLIQRWHPQRGYYEFLDIQRAAPSDEVVRKIKAYLKVLEAPPPSVMENPVLKSQLYLARHALVDAQFHLSDERRRLAHDHYYSVATTPSERMLTRATQEIQTEVKNRVLQATTLEQLESALIELEKHHGSDFELLWKDRGVAEKRSALGTVRKVVHTFRTTTLQKLIQDRVPSILRQREEYLVEVPEYIFFKLEDLFVEVRIELEDLRQIARYPLAPEEVITILKRLDAKGSLPGNEDGWLNEPKLIIQAIQAADAAQNLAELHAAVEDIPNVFNLDAVMYLYICLRKQARAEEKNPEWDIRFNSLPQAFKDRFDESGRNVFLSMANAVRREFAKSALNVEEFLQEE